MAPPVPTATAVFVSTMETLVNCSAAARASAIRKGLRIGFVRKEMLWVASKDVSVKGGKRGQPVRNQPEIQQLAQR